MKIDSDAVEQPVDAAAAEAAKIAGRDTARVAGVIRRELHDVLHRHPREMTAEHRLTTGERWAGRVARASGNWKTILPYLGFTGVYLIVNHWVYAFDATLQYYTFAVSVLAIFLAQVILLFQNRQGDLENALAHNAYEQTSEIFAMEEQQVDVLDAIHTLVQRHEEVLRKIDDMMIDVDTIVHQIDATVLTPEPSASSPGPER